MIKPWSLLPPQPTFLTGALVGLLSFPVTGTGQSVPGEGVTHIRGSGSPAIAHFRTAEAAALNVVVGGLITGAGAWIRGEDFFRGFGWGAVGGALSFSGKYVAGRYPYGGGLVGRQVAEVGHSVALNSSRGDGPLDEVWLAMGPLRYRVRDRGASPDPPLRVNFSSLFAAAEYALRSSTRFSLGESLASGALVFEVRDGAAAEQGNLEVHGIARGAVVLLAGSGTFDRTSTFGHEMVHVIQSDLVTRLVTNPLEQNIRHRVGLASPIFGGIELSNGLQLFNYDPFLLLLEAEAERLQR